MKVCLVFQRRFTSVAHKIALEMQRQGVEEFCGYVYRHSSLEFLERQRDISYSSLLLDERIHDRFRAEPVDWEYIRALEKEIGVPNLWPYILVDRTIRSGQGIREYPYDRAPFSHEEMARIIQVTAKAIREFLAREKPDLIYIPIVSALGNMLLFHLGKKAGATVLVGAETRIESGYCLSEEYTSFTFAMKRFEELKNGARSPREAAAREYLTAYRKRPKTYHYVMESYSDSGTRRKAFAWLSPIRFLRSAGFFLSRLFFRPGIREYSEPALFPALFDALRRNARLMYGFNDLWDTYDSAEPFVYFPLHLEPELALLLLAPHASDQLSIVKRLAESLPFPYKLYVKEHPAMIGFRTRRYYKTLKKIPNLKLIHPNHDSLGIVQDAKLTAVITGTAGWEAVLLGKPVITFGNVYFNVLSGVKESKHPGQLTSLVTEQLERFTPDDEELVRFISALLETSENLRLHELWEKGLDPKSEASSIEELSRLLLHTHRSLKAA